MNLKERIEEPLYELLRKYRTHQGTMIWSSREHIGIAITDILKAIEELLLGEEEMEKIVDIIKDDWKFPCSIAITQALYKAQRDKLK